MNYGGQSGIMTLPRLENAVLPDSKFLQYCLDPDKDPDKACAFKNALGYDKTNYAELIENIKSNLPYFEAKEKGNQG